MLGIGVTTYNRNALVNECLNNIFKYTKTEFKLVVVDDCSDIPYEDTRCIIIRNDKRSGVAFSKNECLRNLNGCDYFFLFDDDCWPISVDWELKYIELYELTGCNAMCFIWDTKVDNTLLNFHTITDTLILQEEIFLVCMNKELRISKDQFLKINEFETNRDLKHSLGLYPWNPHVIEHREVKGLKSHNAPHGVMMFMTRKAIDIAGGFDTNFGIYGGEHDEFFNRMHNMGLTTFKYTDIIGSDKLFRALDRENFHISSVIRTSFDYNLIDSLLASTKNSTRKFDI